MDRQLGAAVTELNEVFARYPRRPVLDACPHCRGGSVTVADHDMSCLAFVLGGTVGGRDDAKGLLPLLLERLVTSTDLDPDIVLGQLRRQEWRAWPSVEQDVIDRYLDAVWRSLLTSHPARVGSIQDAETFLDAILAAGEPLDRYLDAWESTTESAADRHLADTVNTLLFTLPPAAVAGWLRREETVDRLFAAFERDHHQPWAGDLATAHDAVRHALRAWGPTTGS